MYSLHFMSTVSQSLPLTSSPLNYIAEYIASGPLHNSYKYIPNVRCLYNTFSIWCKVSAIHQSKVHSWVIFWECILWYCLLVLQQQVMVNIFEPTWATCKLGPYALTSFCLCSVCSVCSSVCPYVWVCRTYAVCLFYMWANLKVGSCQHQVAFFFRRSRWSNWVTEKLQSTAAGGQPWPKPFDVDILVK